MERTTEERQAVTLLNVIMECKREGENKVTVSYELFPLTQGLIKEAGFTLKKAGKKYEISGGWLDKK